MGKNQQVHENLPVKRTIVLSADKTITEQFSEYMSRYGSTANDIIGFLCIQNEKVTRILRDKTQNVSKDMEDEILEFYDQFMEHHDNDTYQARMRQWGKEPVIFQIAEYIREHRLYLKQKEEFRFVDREILKEAETLAQKIWDIKAYREIQFIINTQDQPVMDAIQIQYPIAKGYWDKPKTFLLYDCVAMLLTKGALIARVQRPTYVEMFSIRADQDGRWIPIPARELMKIYTTAPDGNRIERDESIYYTEIQKPRPIR